MTAINIYTFILMEKKKKKKKGYKNNIIYIKNKTDGKFK